MSIGQKFQGFNNSVADDAYLDIRPSSGVEATVHNIYYSGDVEFYLSNSTDEFKFDEAISHGAILGAVFNVTNTNFLRVKNVSGGAISIGYDGVTTYEEV